MFFIIRIKCCTKKIFFFLSKIYTISRTSKYIYILVVRNTPYGKWHISRTEPVYGKLNVLDQSLHPPQSFLYRCQISSMHSSTRKTPQKRTPKMSIRHLLVNMRNVRVLPPPMLFSSELWRQWQPFIFPPIEASNGALRSAKHERRNVVIRVRGCRMANIQEKLYGVQTQQGVLLSDLLVVQFFFG